MLPCTKHFTTTIGLPCAYIIERRMLEAGGVLKIEDIHPHWRFKKPTQSHDQQGENEENSNTDSAAVELLRVNEPAIIASRGRPPGARNKRTRAQAFEDSTQREPSGFEHVQQQRQRELATTASQVEEQEVDNIANEFFSTKPATPRGGGSIRGGGSTTPRATATLRGRGSAPSRGIRPI